MKKILLIAGLLGSLLLWNASNAGAQMVNENTVTLNKQSVNGFSAQYQVPKSDMEKIMANYFQDKVHKKGKKKKPYLLLAGANWDIIPLSKADIYYRVEGNKTSSKVTVMVSKGYDNFISSATEPQMANDIVSFFTALNPEIDKYNLDQKIIAQNALIAKIQKQNKSAVKEQNKLQNQLQKTQDALDKNQQKQADLNQQIQQQNDILDNLQNQRKQFN